MHSGSWILGSQTILVHKKINKKQAYAKFIGGLNFSSQHTALKKTHGMKIQSNTKSSHHSAASNQGIEARRKLLVSYRNTNQFDMKHAP